MKPRLTRPAARQLDQVLIYIARHNPRGAWSVQDRIRTVMHIVLRHPFAGHATRRRNVRRVLASPYPYAITYSVGDDEIVVLGVRHTVSG